MVSSRALLPADRLRRPEPPSAHRTHERRHQRHRRDADVRPAEDPPGAGEYLAECHGMRGVLQTDRCDAAAMRVVRTRWPTFATDASRTQSVSRETGSGRWSATLSSSSKEGLRRRLERGRFIDRQTKWNPPGLRPRDGHHTLSCGTSSCHRLPRTAVQIRLRPARTANRRASI